MAGAISDLAFPDAVDAFWGKKLGGRILVVSIDRIPVDPRVLSVVIAIF